MVQTWRSPDGKIIKTVTEKGTGPIAYESSRLNVKILSGPPEFTKFSDQTLIVGETVGEHGRIIDICLGTMRNNEEAKFTVQLDTQQVEFVIKVLTLEFNGFIYDWRADKKMEIALRHKELGVQHFAQKNLSEAAYRFTKALKLVCTIPVNVKEPKDVDGVELGVIKALKAQLFNNLASCYFKGRVYELVIDLCKKSLNFDANNIKALYKIGVAYSRTEDFDNAKVALSKVVELEPKNKAGIEELAKVKRHIMIAEVKVNDMMKKMVLGTVSK